MNRMQQGMQLRAKALALLEQAQSIDGLKPMTVTHTFEYGHGTHLLWAKEVPTPRAAAIAIQADFEPGNGETLVIEHRNTLANFVGAPGANRVPENVAELVAALGSEAACA